MDGIASKEPLSPEATDAGVDLSPDPSQEASAQAAEIVHTVAETHATNQAQDPDPASGEGSASDSEQDTIPAPAVEIVHTVADPLDSNVSVEHKQPEGFVSSAGDPMAAAAAGPVAQDTNIGGPKTPDAGDGQSSTVASTTLEQPTADLTSVGVGLGTDSGTEGPVDERDQSVADPAFQAKGHGGPAQVSEAIRTLHPEGSPMPETPVESKWGMEKTPKVETTDAEGLGSKIMRILHLGGSNSPVKVTTSTVPAPVPEAPGAVQAPAETPAPTSNPV